MKIFKKIKKGFTIVELVIVIAVIAILTAILVPTFINISKKANKASDESLKNYLNKALAIVENDPELNTNGANKTMHYAIEDLEAYGILLDRITTKSDEKLVWKQADNRFYFESDIKTDAERLGCWRIQKTVEAGQKYSVYAGDHFADEPVNVSDVGFDAGYHTNIALVNYTGTVTGRAVSIRTNSSSTNVHIDAPEGTVNHFGMVGRVDIEKIDMNCYNELGQAAYVKLVEGKVVAKDGGNISVVFAANNDPAKVAVIEDNGTIDQGFTTLQPVSDENKERVGGIDLAYSIDGAHAATMDDAAKEAAMQTTEQVVVEPAAQSAVSDLRDEELSETVVRAVNSSSTEYYSFEDFAAKVNDGTLATENTTFTLMANVDLKGVELAAIGTKEHPFKGIFDGNGYAVKNFKITSSHAKGEDALFGFVIGNLSMNAVDLAARWNESTFMFDASGLESLYTAAIKNLTVSGASISSPHADNHTDEDTYGDYGVKTNRKSTAAVAAVLRCAYMEKVTVTDSTVNGYKTVGGLVGSLDGGSIVDCHVTDSVKINGYCNIGGIAGALYNANDGYNTAHKHVIISECDNYGEIKKYTADKAYGPVGGILGSGQNDTNAIIDCHNYGTIISINEGTAPSDGTKGEVGGIAGQESGGYIINCTNNGTMTITGTHGYVGGISNYAGSLKIVNCINNSNITANAIQLAGIMAGALSQDIQYVSCINNGALSNTGDPAAVSDIASLNGIAAITNQEYADVAALQAALEAQALQNCSVVSLKNVTVTDKSGALHLPNSVQSVSSDLKVCSSVTLDSGRTKSLLLQLPGISFTYTAGNTVWISSNDATVTVPQGITAPLLSVSGNNTTVVINGTVTNGVSVKGNMVITNNGSIGYINFNGAGSDFVFNNNGEIGGVDGSAHHSVCTTSHINLVVNNKGTIKAGLGNYALLFYGESTVVFNAYATSKIVKASDMGVMAISNGSSPSMHAKLVTINVQEGAEGVGTNSYYGMRSYSAPTYDCRLVINLNAVLA